MPQPGIRFCRTILVVVIFWLLATHAIQLFAGTFRQTLGWLWGLAAMLLTGGLFWFIRWRAERSLGAVEKRWAYYAWWSVPTVLTIAPFAWKAYHWFGRTGAPKGFGATLAAALGALFPVFLELGVPVVLLSAAYLALPAEKPDPGPES